MAIREDRPGRARMSTFLLEPFLPDGPANRTGVSDASIRRFGCRRLIRLDGGQGVLRRCRIRREDG